MPDDSDTKLTEEAAELLQFKLAKYVEQVESRKRKKTRANSKRKRKKRKASAMGPRK